MSHWHLDRWDKQGNVSLSFTSEAQTIEELEHVPMYDCYSGEQLDPRLLKVSTQEWREYNKAVFAKVLQLVEEGGLEDMETFVASMAINLIPEEIMTAALAACRKVFNA